MSEPFSRGLSNVLPSTLIERAFFLFLTEKNKQGDTCSSYGDTRKSQYHKTISCGRTIHIVDSISHKTTDNHDTPRTGSRLSPTPNIFYVLTIPMLAYKKEAPLSSSYLYIRTCLAHAYRLEIAKSPKAVLFSLSYHTITIK